MDKEEFHNLLDKYVSGEASPEEMAMLETWYINYERHDNQVTTPELISNQEESFKQLSAQIHKGSRVIILKRLTAAAAVVVLALSIFLFHGKFNHNAVPYLSQKAIKSDVSPGSNRATLTLSNGRKLVLNAAISGQLAIQGNTVVKKRPNGEISYSATGRASKDTALAFNTATTPRGGFFQLVLSDGTKVWLNSASSIKFPVVFRGSDRQVELTGEAYFEVAHNAKKPFRVVSAGQTVEVLGTHFNINAYPDETTINTTLAEGSVKILSKSQSVIIKPGEQAKFSDHAIAVNKVDVDEVLAWKNGYFSFDDNTIEEVMKQLARWYDVDVKYVGNTSDRRFSGEIPRNVKASQILDVLSFKEIHYKIENKTITIMP